MSIMSTVRRNDRKSQQGADVAKDFKIKLRVCVMEGGGSAKLGTDLQRGRQDAQAVQTLVELRVVGPPQEGLAEFRLTPALGATAQGANSALLARPEQVPQGRALAAAFTDTETRPGELLEGVGAPRVSNLDIFWTFSLFHTYFTFASATATTRSFYLQRREERFHQDVPMINIQMSHRAAAE